MESDSDPASPATGPAGPAVSSTGRTVEAAAESERAIAVGEREGTSADLHPRVHQAMIETMRSELELLREQIDAR